MATLILVRHGQSIWNESNQFTGWIDVPLSEQGHHEAGQAGEVLKNYPFDIAFTSTLIRAQQTIYTILDRNTCHKGYYGTHDGSWYQHLGSDEARSGMVPIEYHEALNERYYGDLQGRNKKQATEEFGEEQIHEWRRSFAVAPPNGESLKMTMERTLPFFHERIAGLLRDDHTVLIAAHHNSLRSIVKFLEDVSDEDIPHFEMKTGVPRVYHMDDQLQVKEVKNLSS